MFSGAITAMVSPLSGGKLDEGRLRANIELQITSGIDGLVPVGTTGESPTLDFHEHERVIELTVQVAKGRVPVIAGVGGNATDEALRLHQYARDVGADAGLSVNPYYNKPTQEGLYHHFMTLADRVKLPIVLYNIPGRTGVNMTPQTVARLARHDNIVAIKEAAGSLDQVSEIRALCDLPILCGDDSLTLPMMAIGAAGVISVASNVIPKQIKQLVTLAREGRFDRASELHHRLFPFIKTLFLDGNPVGVKYAMKLAGMDTGELRSPLWEASETTKKQIAEQMRKLDVPLKAP
jgi:4-hydroxy-tetrahydrodipicolinate synthase